MELFEGNKNQLLATEFLSECFKGTWACHYCNNFMLQRRKTKLSMRSDCTHSCRRPTRKVSEVKTSKCSWLCTFMEVCEKCMNRNVYFTLCLIRSPESMWTLHVVYKIYASHMNHRKYPIVADFLRPEVQKNIPIGLDFAASLSTQKIQTSWRKGCLAGFTFSLIGLLLHPAAVHPFTEASIFWVCNTPSSRTGEATFTSVKWTHLSGDKRCLESWPLQLICTWNTGNKC